MMIIMAKVGEGRLGQSGAQEETAIHHVDSTLGLLVAISVFFASVLSDLVQELVAGSSAIFVILIALLIAVGLLTWVIGVLRQSWPLKVSAWLSIAYTLLYESYLVIIIVAVAFAGVSMPRVLIIAGLFVPVLGASLFMWYVVRRAYLDRLSTTPRAEELTDKIDAWSRRGCWLSLAIASVACLLLMWLLR